MCELNQINCTNKIFCGICKHNYEEFSHNPLYASYYNGGNLSYSNETKVSIVYTDKELKNKHELFNGSAKRFLNIIKA